MLVVYCDSQFAIFQYVMCASNINVSNVITLYRILSSLERYLQHRFDTILCEC